MIEILTPDLAPLDGVEIPNLEAGQDSIPIPFVLRNTNVLAVPDVLVVLQVQDPVTGHWLSADLPPLDELWPRLRTPGQDWIPVGTGRALHLATLPQGLTSGEIKLRPPATAAALTWQFRLAVIAAENSYPVPAGHRQGILTGLGDPGHSALLRGFEVTTTTPPSDRVQVAAGQLIHRGRLLGRAATEITLDQQDATGAPLTPGNSYLALLTAGPEGLTVTKSQGTPVPTRPSPPHWEPPLAVLEVLAVLPEAVSEIGAPQITDLRLFDRYHAEPGPGLKLRLHAGRAIAGGTLRYHSTSTDLPLPPNAITAVWQRASGAWELTASIEGPPETTILGPLWLATTDVERVIALQDRRTFAVDTVVLHLRGPLPEIPGPIAETLIVEEGLILERVLYRLADPGAGAGHTMLDLHLEGTTLYPSEDHHPTWPSDTSNLVHQTHIHDPTDLRLHQLLQLVSLEHPTSQAPARAEAWLLCRRP